MRTSFTATAAVVVVAAAFSGAAVIPRANINPGLETRYYRNEVYARAVPVEVPHVKRAHVENRRTHPREFRLGRVVV